jgi:hypothetical protein
VIWSSLARLIVAGGVAVFGCCVASPPPLRPYGLSPVFSLLAKSASATFCRPPMRRVRSTPLAYHMAAFTGFAAAGWA